MTVSNWDESLHRALAVLQVQFRLLDQQAEQFTELPDMMAHRRIKSELTDYIAAHSRAGKVPPDPLAEQVSRLRKLASFFAEASALHRTSVSSHQRFLQRGHPVISLSDVHQGQLELNEAIAKFPVICRSLASQLSELDWSANGEGSDIHPELLYCAQGVGMNFLEEANARRAFRLLALGRGELHQQIQDHFKTVRSCLEDLARIHTKHHEALRLALAEAKQGNYLSAKKLLVAAGLEEQPFKGFSDLDYEEVTTSIAVLRWASDEAKSFAKDLPAACNKILNDFEAKSATRKRSTGYDQAKRRLATLRSIADQHLRKISALPGSELEIECRPALEAAQPKLIDTESTLAMMAATGARSRRRFLFTTATTIGMAILIVLGWGISQSLKRADIQAKEAVERQVADAKAAANRIASEKAKVNAELVAAAEAQTKAEHDAAEAQAYKDRVADEARVNAERHAAETKAKAERDATEAKAKAERVAAEVAALRLQVTAAEATLAEAKLQFQKQEAEFSEARKARGGFLSNIAEQIAVKKRELGEAGFDTAEEKYGTMLMQLFNSFKGDGFLSGATKIPRSTFGAGILVHAPKSQYSKTATGNEDLSNVRSYYFLGDLAFVNIPARDNYTWSESRKIDKLLLEYLAVSKAYNARRQTLIDQQNEILKIEAEVRAELRSIDKAEKEAREHLNRAQGRVDLLRINMAARSSEDAK